MDESSINYYLNGSLISSKIQESLTLYYSDISVEIQNTNASTWSIFEEISVWFGIQESAQNISLNWNNRYPLGQNYGIIHTRDITHTLEFNYYNTKQEITFTDSPVGHFQKFNMNELEILNDGTNKASRPYIYNSRGSVIQGVSTNNEEPITELTNQSFTLATIIKNITYTKQTLIRNITDTTTNLHVLDTTTYPFIYGEYYCNQLNQFVIDFYMNTAYNGVYKVIQEYSGNVFIDGVDTSVYSNTLTNNYGYRVKLPTTLTNVLTGNAYTLPLIQNGLLGFLKSNNVNIITSSSKELKVNQLPHTSHITTYDIASQTYTTQVYLNNLLGTETSCVLEIWTNDLEIDNVLYSGVVQTTSNTYETGFTGKRLTLTGGIIPNNPISFSFKK